MKRQNACGSVTYTPKLQNAPNGEPGRNTSSQNLTVFQPPRSSRSRKPMNVAIVDILMEEGGGHLYDYKTEQAEKLVQMVLKRYGL
jgi:hypothetical protein